jgi:DHA1 family inner membrane transport protein
MHVKTDGKTQKLPIALWALALASFGIGTTELVPMGLLPTMAKDLEVSLFSAGLLISVYALGVVVGVPLLSLFSTKIQRKTLLLLLVGGFIFGNLLCAWAPNYIFLMIARVVVSFMHGTFFGESYVVAARLAPEKQTSALALVSSGLTLSTVLGAPLGTYLGLTFDWRVPFYVIAGIGLISFVAIVYFVPNMTQQKVASLRKQTSVLRRPSVVLALCMTVFGIAGVFTVLTYITPMLEQLTRVSPHDVSAILLVYGVGTLIGNFVGAKFADKRLMPTLLVVLTLLAVVLASLTFSIYHPIVAIITIFFWGVAAFASIPPLQMRILEKSSDAPQFASGLNVAAFNLGNALGAFLGGVVVENPALNLSSLPWIAAFVTLIGVIFTIISMLFDKKLRRKGDLINDPF